MSSHYRIKTTENNFTEENVQGSENTANFILNSQIPEQKRFIPTQVSNRSHDVRTNRTTQENTNETQPKTLAKSSSSM